MACVILIMNNEEKYLNAILNFDDYDKVVGEIYLMTNLSNNKKYVGQTVSHRKNKGKYRSLGFNGRFNDHISEAINNTKKKQCTYLNNAIRNYGKDSFKCELIERCALDELNDLETFWIKVHKSLYPNGYNLTKGGKTPPIMNTCIKILNEKRNKRGRDFGYQHKDSTKEKMSSRLKEICDNEDVKSRMRNTMKDFYDKQKVEILKNYDLGEDIEKHIKPVKNKNTNEIHDYIIKINRRKLTLYSSDENLDQKYNRLKNILLLAKKP